MKIRWTEVEIETVKAGAKVAGQDVSSFIRSAALKFSEATMDTPFADYFMRKPHRILSQWKL